MIEFTRLHLGRFLTFQEDVEIDLRKRGLVLVRGVNEDDPTLDSNDAGKSNLFSAITWVLFERLAKTGAKIPGDSVVTKGCVNCTVSLEWEDGKTKYQVVRHRKHSIGGDTVQLTKAGVAKKAANEDIVKALGMTYDMFLWSVFWAQSTSIRRLTEFRDSDFKDLFDQLIRTEHYEGKRKKVADRLKAIAEELDTVQSDIRAQTVLKDELDRQIKEEQDQVDQFKGVDMVAIKKLVDKVAESERTLAKLTHRQDSASRRVQSVSLELATKQDAYKDTADEFKQVAAGLATKRCSQCRQPLASRQSIQVVEQKRDKLRADGIALKKELKELHVSAKDAEAEFLAYEAKTGALGKVINSFNKRLYALMPPGFLAGQKGVSALNTAYLSSKASKTRLKVLQGRKSAVLIEMEELEKRAKRLALRDSRYQLLDRAYGPAGLRTLRLVRLTPHLNRYAREYSERLVEGALVLEFSTTTTLKGGEVREKYQIDVSRDKSIDFELSGGGMKRRADLIAAFALDKLRRRITGKEVNIRIYDEPTDGVDAAGEEAVLQVLREDCPGTTMFVSHKAFVDATFFDDAITVRRTNNVSRLEGK